MGDAELTSDTNMPFRWSPPLRIADINVGEVATRSKMSVSDRWFWDFAPVYTASGEVHSDGKSQLWVALTAPKGDDAAMRHFVAKLCCLSFDGQTWTWLTDLGLRSTHPGSREWAGMAIATSGTVKIYFTAAGDESQSMGGYQQRLWLASAPIEALTNPGAQSSWSDARELVCAHSGPYLPASERQGLPGQIRAFRDPFFFRAPDCGFDGLLFTATSSEGPAPNCGAIGFATATPDEDDWQHRGPIVTANHVAAELERPHVVFRNDLVYLFWSTPRYAFAREFELPSGLYGLVAPSLDGPFEPLNGNSLVIANPLSAPYQHYSWFVTPQLDVVAFVDMPDFSDVDNSKAAPTGAERFCGHAAPMVKLELSDYRAIVVGK